MTRAWVVVVEGNLISAIEPSTANELAPGSRLEVGTELANNFKENGSIDGRYVFSGAPEAQAFAILCLEFVKALLDRHLRTIKELASGATFRAGRRPAGYVDPP